MRRMAGIAPGFEERMVRRRRFRFQHINPCTGKVSAGNSIERGQHVHDSAAGSVDQERAARHLGDGLGIQKVKRLRRERAVGADNVRFPQQVAERFRAMHAEGFVAAIGNVGIVEHDVHAKGFRAQRGGGANASDADDTECPPAQPRHGGGLRVGPRALCATQTAVHQVNASR